MRYVACLQRADSVHTDVAMGNDLAEVLADARAIYAALIPNILERGMIALSKERSDSGQRTGAGLALQFGWLPGSTLAAEEWGVGVYDRQAADYPEFVHWVGASREKSLSETPLDRDEERSMA